ncbi:MAG: DUF378 domain-containing protein [Flavobacteriia bacterium]|nr:DUF378 domain-containing protein [Flavobacteriia bacterium]
MSITRVIFQICFVFMIIGCLNWGLVAMDPENNIIKNLFPDTTIIRSIIYSFISICSRCSIFSFS